MENRRLKRKHLIYYLRIFFAHNRELVGHLVDITTEGIMVISEEPIENNTVYEFVMDLPEEIAGKKEMHFKAKCVWATNASNPDFYDSGYTLVDASEENLLIIKTLVQIFGFGSEKEG
ncbi:MAG: PilZ domain-containing protein [Fibrobacterales bacterium]